MPGGRGGYPEISVIWLESCQRLTMKPFQRACLQINQVWQLIAGFSKDFS